MCANPPVEDSGCTLAPRDLTTLNRGLDLMFTERPPLTRPDCWNFLGY